MFKQLLILLVLLAVMFLVGVDVSAAEVTECEPCDSSSVLIWCAWIWCAWIWGLWTGYAVSRG